MHIVPVDCPEFRSAFRFECFSDLPAAPAQICWAKAELAAMRPSRTIATQDVFIFAVISCTASLIQSYEYVETAHTLVYRTAYPQSTPEMAIARSTAQTRQSHYAHSMVPLTSETSREAVVTEMDQARHNSYPRYSRHPSSRRPPR